MGTACHESLLPVSLPCQWGENLDRSARLWLAIGVKQLPQLDAALCGDSHGWIMCLCWVWRCNFWCSCLAHSRSPSQLGNAVAILALVPTLIVWLISRLSPLHSLSLAQLLGTPQVLPAIHTPKFTTCDEIQNHIHEGGSDTMIDPNVCR